MASNANIIGIATGGSVALDKWKNITDPVAFANATNTAIAEAKAIADILNPPPVEVGNVTNIFGFATKTNGTLKPTANQT